MYSSRFGHGLDCALGGVVELEVPMLEEVVVLLEGGRGDVEGWRGANG